MLKQRFRPRESGFASAFGRQEEPANNRQMEEK